MHLMITFKQLEPNEVHLFTDGSSYADYIVRSNNKFSFSPIQLVVAMFFSIK